MTALVVGKAGGLGRRCRTPERMDDPGLDEGRHRRALRALGRVNRLSLAGRRLASEVRRVAAATNRGAGGGEPLRVLDLACGGGDVLRTLARWGRRREMALELHGCDVSDVAVRYARSRSAGVRDGLTFSRLDVLSDPLPRGYDLITTSLFLHHLADDEAVSLLARMAEVAETTLFVQDLRRTWRGYALAFVALRLLSGSRVARADGPRSVRAAFTLDEARNIAERAGLTGARISACWPQRFLLRWEADLSEPPPAP